MREKIWFMILIFLVTMLVIGSIFSSAVYIDTDRNNILTSKINHQSISSDVKTILGENSNYFSPNCHNTNSLIGGSSLDQYQTYADCWIGTNYYVLKLAQSFKPSLEFLDYVQLKIWINFTSPVVDIIFYICSSDGGVPGSIVTGGISETYSSDDFLYSQLVPDPNDDYSTPWFNIEFPNDPHLTVGETYWIVIEIVEHLSDDKHVWLAGEYNGGELYPDGCLAYFSNEYNWNSNSTIDLMFKTYGYNQESNTPTADAGGPYYGYIGGGETVSFDGGSSFDNDEGGHCIERFDWKFFEGDSWHNNIGSTPSYTYTSYGTYIVTLRVHDDEGDTDTDTGTVTIYPPGPPHVNYVESFYADGSEASDGNGLLLQGMNLSNNYTASISGADIDEVEFYFDFFLPWEQCYRDTDGLDGWTATINTKNIINPYGTVKVRAHNQHGWSDYKEYTPRIIPVVGWLVQFIQYVCNYNETDFASFSVAIKDDPPKLKNNYWILEAAVDFSFGSPENPDESPVEAGVDVPVDDVGGNYNYSGGIGSSVRICSDGTIDVRGGFNASVTVKGASGGIGASLHGSLTISDEIIWEYMYLTIHGEATIPVFYIPLEICGIGIEAGIDITPHVEITFHLDPTDDSNDGIVPGLGIKIKENKGINGSVGAKVRAYAEAGFGIGDFYTEAGGDGTLEFQTPSPPGYFKDFILSCWIGGRLRLLYWTIEGWWQYEWRYSDQRLSDEYKNYTETNWTTLDRDYTNPDNGKYNDFIWDDSKDSGTIINNAFPYANPYVAYFPNSAGNKIMMVWSHDNESQPVVKGMEIQYTIWDRDEGMHDPQPIQETNNDDKLQMDPKLAFDRRGNAICIFTQTDESISENSDIIEVCNATEIAYSIWNKTSETWSSIKTITNNNKMDISPVLTSNSNGDIVLVWISDNDNNHTTINDRSIYASFWNGNNWSDILTVAENQPLASTPQTAISDDGDTAICVFTKDEDDDLGTTTDQNIFYTTFSPSISSGDIVQFTDDYVYQNTAPSVVYGQDENAYIIWLRNEYNDDGDEEIYNGTLYYKELDSTRAESNIITRGTFSDPRAIYSQGSFRYDDFNFAVGWGGGISSDTLHCAKIKNNDEIESGVIYGSDLKMSEIHWCIAPGSITAAAIERPTLKRHNKNCNLTFVYAHGFDDIPPVTICTLDGELLGYSAYGPIYRDSVMISLDATDIGGSGLDKTYYRLNSGSEQIYDGSPLIVTEKKAHMMRYYSKDKAGNIENINIEQFEIVETMPPLKPLQPSGPTEGKPGVKYKYITSTTDPDKNPVYYLWHWGDEFSTWMGPYDSGDICEAEHIWDSKGYYEIKVKAKDIYNEESNWSDPLEVSMPVNHYSINSQRLLSPRCTLSHIFLQKECYKKFF